MVLIYTLLYGAHSSIVAYVLDYEIVGSEFEFFSRYYCRVSNRWTNNEKLVDI